MTPSRTTHNERRFARRHQRAAQIGVRPLSGPPEAGLATDPQVSVIIPTRNRWSLLQHALDSVLAQEEVSVEAIVVDDGSDDPTGAERLDASTDERVRVIRLDAPGGPARARNVGIEAARGQWIAFLDDDDVWSPRKLRAQLDAAAERDATYAYGSAIVFDDSSEVRQVMTAPPPDGVASEILRRNVIPGGCSNLIARADAVRAVGGFDERLRVLADWDLWIRLAQSGRGAAADELVVGYRRHPGSMVLSGDGKPLAELDMVAEKYDALSRAAATRTETIAFYRYFARAHRRSNRRLAAARLYTIAAWRGRSPGDLARALVVLFGPGAERVARVVKRRKPPRTPIAPPDWLVPRSEST